MKKAIFLLPVLLILSITHCQSSLIFYPDKKYIMKPGDHGLSYDTVEFKAEDGVRLSGWWIPSSGEKGTLLFCHGNAGNISYRIESLKIFMRLGLNSFIFDYRGYGRSEGIPSEEGTYLDAQAAWDYLTKIKKIKSSEIIIFGRSLGGSIASWLAGKRQPGLLILESTFTSIEDVAREHYPSFLVNIILSYRYSTIDYIKKINCPVLIIHSSEDELIPISHGKKLYETAREPKVFLEIKGSHNEGFYDSKKIYTNGLEQFISKYFNKEGP